MLGVGVRFSERGDASQPEDYDFCPLLDEQYNSTRFYMHLMYGIIRANAYKDLVEIGVFRGVNTSFLARAAKLNGGHVRALDCETEHIRLAKSHLEFLGLDGYVSFFHGDSARFTGDPVDFVFVDGNHLYEGVKGDWLVWNEHVRVGGTIAFHDTADEAIDRFLKETFPRNGWEFINFPGDCGFALARKTS